jgi:very-short-patch-repair endonuclease
MENQNLVTKINDIYIIENYVKNLPYNKILAIRARENRKLGILVEVLFWKKVKSKNFFGIDFDRQRVIGNYIVDFYVRQIR